MAAAVTPTTQNPAPDGRRANVIQTLDAFYLEHGRCGNIEAGVGPEASPGPDVPEDIQWVAWMECPSCGVRCEVTRDR